MVFTLLFILTGLVIIYIFNDVAMIRLYKYIRY